MITVHHLENSRSQRILWLLEELQVPYDVKFYKRDKQLLAPPELRAVHPLGKSPIITDGGRAIAETGAIMEYLLSAHGGGLVPTDPDDRLNYIYWMYAAEGTFMTPLLLKLIAEGIRRRTPWPVKPVGWAIAGTLDKTLIKGQLAAIFDLWENALSRTPWFAGANFSAADIMMSFPVETAAARAGAGTPRIRAWLEAIHARPAYKAALERGGPYAYA